MDIKVTKKSTHTVLSVSGSLDANNSSDADTKIQPLLPEIESLIIDLSNLEYISSAGLRLLLTIAKQMQKQEGRLLLASPSKQVGNVLEISGFSTIFSIFDSISEAQASLEKE